MSPWLILGRPLLSCHINVIARVFGRIFGRVFGRVQYCTSAALLAVTSSLFFCSLSDRTRVFELGFIIREKEKEEKEKECEDMIDSGSLFTQLVQIHSLSTIRSEGDEG